MPNFSFDWTVSALMNREERIRREFKETPTSRLVTLTPEQDDELRRVIELEEAGKAETIARYQHLRKLMAEDSIFGVLRTTLEEGDFSHDAVAGEAGLDRQKLTDFLWGDAELTADEIDRLARALRLHLVPIPA